MKKIFKKYGVYFISVPLFLALALYSFFMDNSTGFKLSSCFLIIEIMKAFVRYIGENKICNFALMIAIVVVRFLCSINILYMLYLNVEITLPLGVLLALFVLYRIFCSIKTMVDYTKYIRSVKEYESKDCAESEFIAETDTKNESVQ